MSADFTAYINPNLAVACPDCTASIGTWCKRPSGHKATGLHSARKTLADEVFIAQHGKTASIDLTETGWQIDPSGYRRSDPS